MALPLILAGTAIAGTGLSIYGQIRAAQAQEEAAQREAALKEMQAQELLGRQLINERIMREQGLQAESNYATSFASSGREGGLGGQVQIYTNTMESIRNSRREAEFKAKMLRMGADIELGLASDRKTAGYITGAGTAIGAIPQLYSSLRGPGKVTSLPGGEKSGFGDWSPTFGRGDSLPDYDGSYGGKV